MHRGFPAKLRELPTLPIYIRTNRSDAPGIADNTTGIAGFGCDDSGRVVNRTGESRQYTGNCRFAQSLTRNPRIIVILEWQSLCSERRKDRFIKNKNRFFIFLDYL